jgi:hypothetical protein
MQRLRSAKWIILLTVLINIVTTFTVVTLCSDMFVANATALLCSQNNQLLNQTFNSNGYSGILTTTHNPTAVTLATITMKFVGNAPSQSDDVGSLSAVDITVVVAPNAPGGFQAFKGAPIDTSSSSSTGALQKPSDGLNAPPPSLQSFWLYITDSNVNNPSLMKFTGGGFFTVSGHVVISGSWAIPENGGIWGVQGGIDGGDKGSWYLDKAL